MNLEKEKEGKPKQKPVKEFTTADQTGAKGPSTDLVRKPKVSHSLALLWFQTTVQQKLLLPVTFTT